MKRKIAFLMCSLFVLSICLCLPTIAQSTSVEDQISVLRKQMDSMQKQVKDLEAELEKAKQDASSAQQQVEKASKQMEEKVAEVSGKTQVIDELAKRFGHIKLGGYVRSRFWDGQQAPTSFDVTEIAMNVRYDVSENISGEFHLWWHPSGNTADGDETSNYRNWAGPTVFFESAFAEFRNLNIGPVKGKLLVGKSRNWAFGITPAGGPKGRVTSDYSLVESSLNQSRITGLQYLTTYDINETQKLTANFALFNGWGLAGSGTTRNSGQVRTRDYRDAKAVRVLRNGQNNLDDNNNKAFSTRFGFIPLQGLDVGFSFYRERLSSNDLAVFNDMMGRSPGTFGNPLGSRSKDTDHRVYGFDLTYERGPFVLKSMYFEGEVSDVDAQWWSVMAGYKLKGLKTDIYLRYSQANYDQHRYADMRASGAWDKSQITPLLIYYLHPRAQLYFEYYFNMENAPKGAHHIDDNYGFIELILHY